MRIVGNTAYTSRLDGRKLTDFLREQGMSERNIARLEIRFLHRIPGFWSRSAYGHHHGRRQIISLATWMYDDASTIEQEGLYALNETLMHEIHHALDQEHGWVQWASLSLHAACVVLPLLLDWFFLQGTLWFWFPFIIILVVGPRLAYR